MCSKRAFTGFAGFPGSKSPPFTRDFHPHPEPVYDCDLFLFTSSGDNQGFQGHATCTNVMQERNLHEKLAWQGQIIRSVLIPSSWLPRAGFRTRSARSTRCTCAHNENFGPGRTPKTNFVRAHHDQPTGELLSYEKSARRGRPAWHHDRWTAGKHRSHGLRTPRRARFTQRDSDESGGQSQYSQRQHRALGSGRHQWRQWHRGHR